jgi:hypothetical protein
MQSKADKADALLTAGAVTPQRLRPGGGGIVASVRGEHGTYEAAAWYDERGRLIYTCTCDYIDFHPGKRDCSHAIAAGKLAGSPSKEATR